MYNILFALQGTRYTTITSHDVFVSGPLVWYQTFEYAIGHWFQKATEHVLGCVLCSPGCFSLFRASALLDDNVMKRYTTESTEAAHYLQYDQGDSLFCLSPKYKTIVIRPTVQVLMCTVFRAWFGYPQVRTGGCVHCFCSKATGLTIAPRLTH